MARKGSKRSGGDRKGGRPDRDRKRDDRGRERRGGRPPRKKVCQFCKERVDYVDFKDISTLRRYVNDRGRIRARRVTGTCARHQGLVASAVKNAREVALLPYVIR